MSTRPFVYNPDQKSREQLIAEFVIRREVFEELFTEFREAARDIPPQHFLLAGQRGMGKTTLLLRLKYAVEDDAKLRKYLLPVRFREEQYNIGRLERLWEETAQLLAIQSTAYEDLYETMLIHEAEADYERICFDLLEARLKKKKQRALLMIDNIGDLFDKFPEIQNHRLRQLLMSSPYIQLIGASSRVLEHTFRYDKPFFEFFREIKLSPLSEEACHTLLRALGESYGETEKIEYIIRTHPGRIDALRQITGGVPRTMVLLYQIFADNENGTAFEDLQLLLDSVNALYKHRMDELKPQQQQLMDALARAWDAITAAEVLRLSKLYREGVQSNQVSAQLKQLADNQIVEVVEGPGRSKSYRIRERFFNVWYLMRYGKKQNYEQVQWLIKFFEAWYNTKNIKTVLEKQRETMRSGTYSYQAAYLRTMALLGNGQVAEDDKNVLKEETVEYLLKKGKRELARDIGAIGKKADTYARLTEGRYSQGYAKGEDKLTYLRESVLKDLENYFKEATAAQNPTNELHADFIFIAFAQEDTKQVIYWAEKLLSEHADHFSSDHILIVCMVLLRANQYNFLLEQFHAPNGILLQRAKPVYYALAYFMPDELPGVYQKTSPEIAEAVEDIIRTVKEAQAREGKPE